jgi:hypothetical protein
MPLPEILCSTLFAAIYKRPTEGGGRETLAFCLWLVLWALEGFLDFGFCFGLFGVGSFWKGKELLKGKEL